MTIESRLTALETITGSITEAQNDKIDLPDGKSQSDIDYVVEYKAATSADPTWYRVYKSGWVEQGGTQTFSAVTGKQIDITFSKPFLDTNYIINPSILTNTNNNVYTFIGIYGKSATTARIVINVYNSSASQLVGCDWYACGQGATS